MSGFEPLLTELDAARFLNTHPGTLRNWRSKGMGPPYVAVGAAVRYAPGDLRQYIEARTIRRGTVRSAKLGANSGVTASLQRRKASGSAAVSVSGPRAIDQLPGKIKRVAATGLPNFQALFIARRHRLASTRVAALVAPLAFGEGGG